MAKKVWETVYAPHATAVFDKTKKLTGHQAHWLTKMVMAKYPELDHYGQQVLVALLMRTSFFEKLSDSLPLRHLNNGEVRWTDTDGAECVLRLPKVRDDKSGSGFRELRKKGIIRVDSVRDNGDGIKPTPIYSLNVLATVTENEAPLAEGYTVTFTWRRPQTQAEMDKVMLRTPKNARNPDARLRLGTRNRLIDMDKTEKEEEVAESTEVPPKLGGRGTPRNGGTGTPKTGGYNLKELKPKRKNNHCARTARALEENETEEEGEDTASAAIATAMERNALARKKKKEKALSATVNPSSLFAVWRDAVKAHHPGVTVMGMTGKQAGQMKNAAKRWHQGPDGVQFVDFLEWCAEYWGFARSHIKGAADHISIEPTLTALFARMLSFLDAFNHNTASLLREKETGDAAKVRRLKARGMSEEEALLKVAAERASLDEVEKLKRARLAMSHERGMLKQERERLEIAKRETELAASGVLRKDGTVDLDKAAKALGGDEARSKKPLSKKPSSSRGKKFEDWRE